jgi:hypothetical protein
LAGCENEKQNAPPGTVVKGSDKGETINPRPGEKPNWKAECVSQAPFSVEFRSASGDVTEDDMTVAVRWQDGSGTSLSLKPAWFVEATHVTSDIQNLCTTVVGYPLPNKRVLLWILRNDRPFDEQLQLALLDVEARQVLDIKSDVGEVGLQLTVAKSVQGFEVRVFDGRQLSRDGGEEAVPACKRISIIDDRIVAKPCRNPKLPNTPLQPTAEKRGG